MFHRAFTAAVALLVVAAPAKADKYFAVTPSGLAEMMFAGMPADVTSRIASRCMDLKWTVISSNASEVTCESPLNMGQSILGQMLMGNSYSTPPRRFFRFNAAQVSGVTRVQASGWMELQMAFGQVKRADFTGPEFQNSIVMFLASAGGKYPVGTTFPNHVMMGFDSDLVAHGRYYVPKIKSVVPGSPAAKAGFQVGDLVTVIAGEKLKSDNDFLDAIARAAKTPTYDVEIVRGGQKLSFTLERAFRPTWTEEVIPVVPAPPVTAVSTTLPSVADELAKLAKLKADGILSEAEFEAQKRKLLDK